MSEQLAFIPGLLKPCSLMHKSIQYIKTYITLLISSVKTFSDHTLALTQERYSFYLQLKKCQK